MTKQRVGLLFGGSSGEHEVAISFKVCRATTGLLDYFRSIWEVTKHNFS